MTTIRIPASYRLSTEIWCTILRYAISVPDFLDSDVFDGLLSTQWLPGPLLHDEDAYWRSENIRNRLQLVVKSWDRYLRQFEHRFVRMSDVAHKRVTLQHLQSAIRVSFESKRCICQEYCRKPDDGYDYSHIWEKVDIMKMQILQFSVKNNGDIHLQGPQCPNLRTVISSRSRAIDVLAREVTVLPTVRNFCNTMYHVTGNSLLRQDIFSENLVALSLFIDRGVQYDRLTLDLPSLRHLQILLELGVHMQSSMKDALRGVLRVVGHELRSFHLLYGNFEDVMGEIWSLCPKMETFMTTLAPVEPPPRAHPVHTLVLCIGEHLRQVKPPPEWPNLKKVVLLHGWSRGALAAVDEFLSTRDNVALVDGRGNTQEEHEKEMLEGVES